MTTLGVSASGPRSAEEVWERYARPALWSTWAPQIRRVEVEAERLSGGEHGRVHGPLGLSVDFVVDTWDEDARRWTWTVTPRLPVPNVVPVPTLRLEHGVEAAGTGSVTRLRVSGPALVVVPYLAPARLALHRLVH
jgi:hypothetical protein